MEMGIRRNCSEEGNEVSLENVFEVTMEHIGGDSYWRLDMRF